MTEWPNHALQRTRRERRGCNRCVPRAGSLSLVVRPRNGGSVITSQQFKQRWERVEGDCLVAFSDASLSDVRLPADARAFLVEAGLPEEAPPFLNFNPPKSGTLERVSSIYRQPAAFDPYRIIGG